MFMGLLARMVNAMVIVSSSSVGGMGTWQGLHMCITEHYLLQAKLLKVFHNFKLFEGKNKNQNMT